VREFSKWIGKCPSCGSWNTYQEEIIYKPTTKIEKRQSIQPKGTHRSSAVPILIPEIQAGVTQRLVSPDPELNRVLGGGIVKASLILLGGEPGIGKSTLLLQTALRLNKKVLYVSGEESEEQIKMRADRIFNRENQCYVLTETNTEKIINHAQKLAPD